MNRSIRGRRTKKHRTNADGPRELSSKISDMGGPTGFALEIDPTAAPRPGRAKAPTSSASSNLDHSLHQDRTSATAAGLYGLRREALNPSSHVSSVRRQFSTASSRASRAVPHRAVTGTSAAASVSAPSIRSRFSRASGSNNNKRDNANHRNNQSCAVHIVCAVSENLARETCVSSIDAGSPTSVQVTKQGNGQTYAETVAYLELLQPDEVLLNEGRQNSQLARKVMELYRCVNQSGDGTQTTRLPLGETNRRHPSSRRSQRNRTSGRTGSDIRENTDNYYFDNDGDGEDVQENMDQDNRFGSVHTSTVVKFIPRACFDQTKGAELLQRIARPETYDATVVEEYILLSSAHAVLHYLQLSLGANLAKHSLYLSINTGGQNRMAIDRSTILQLELLVNAKTGKAKDSLVGTIDCTKTTVGSRLLRSNLMSPPTRLDTIQSRLELVHSFMGSEEFFYNVLEHLQNLPDVDKMLSNIALIPNHQAARRRRNSAEQSGKDSNAYVVNVRLASKGISALVCIKATLQALPSFVGVLNEYLESLNVDETIGTRASGRDDAATIATDRSSLLVGLGAAGAYTGQIHRQHLLRAIVYTMSQSTLGLVLAAVSNIFTETTTFSRNAHAMRHQECFALKSEDDGMMSVIRKAFLANVDDIYKKADEYAEVFGFTVSVRFSTARGYFLAVPLDMATDLPQVFLQPAKSGRFISCLTEEVISLNTRARDNVQDLLLMTHDRIQEVMGIARLHYDSIAALSDSIALLDMCHSFADHVTLSPSKWCVPVLFERSEQRQGDAAALNASGISSNLGASMVIRNGRYPINAAGLTGLMSVGGPSGQIPNDTYANDEKFFTVITGINGSGKSTYLKQIAIITVLAHCGSYVPAEQATIPIRDRLCCRIGNTDDQEHNISTFMLEMKETAFICNNATNRSLVLMDELGRATSNEDGVAIAWSTSEYLLKKHALTFFATHYPQLSSLAKAYPCVQNIHMQAAVTRGDQGAITYTYKVKPGVCAVATDYGVELASFCGWPQAIVDDARELQDSVSALLPHESLCHERSLDNVSETRTKAYRSLRQILLALQSLVSGEKEHTCDTIRNHLIALKQKYVPTDDEELVRCMCQLLSRERRKIEKSTLDAGQDVSTGSRSGETNSVRSPHSENSKGPSHFANHWSERSETSSSGSSGGTSDLSSTGSEGSSVQSVSPINNARSQSH